jgi:hypothetical protein
MSEGAAEGGGGGDALSGAQFGDVTESTDLPPFSTPQDPGNGIGLYGFYPLNGPRPKRNRARRRKHRRER